MAKPALVQRCARNGRGRDLIVGDVHGCFTKLRASLAAVGFDPEAGDRLFSVGDLVDRGPESEEVLWWLSQPWFAAVQGNHEEWAVRYAAGECDLRNYAANGGSWFIAKTATERQDYVAVLRELPLAIELETGRGVVGIVHADVPHASWGDMVRDLQQLDREGLEFMSLCAVLRWGRDRAERLMDDGVSGVRAVVVGHTPVQRIASLGNVIFLDTGGWFPERREAGHFPLLDAETLLPAAAVVTPSSAATA